MASVLETICKLTEGMTLQFAGYTILFIRMYSVFKYYISDTEPAPVISTRIHSNK